MKGKRVQEIQVWNTYAQNPPPTPVAPSPIPRAAQAAQTTTNVVEAPSASLAARVCILAQQVREAEFCTVDINVGSKRKRGSPKGPVCENRSPGLREPEPLQQSSPIISQSPRIAGPALTRRSAGLEGPTRTLFVQPPSPVPSDGDSAAVLKKFSVCSTPMEMELRRLESYRTLLDQILLEAASPERIEPPIVCVAPMMRDAMAGGMISCFSVSAKAPGRAACSQLPVTDNDRQLSQIIVRWNSVLHSIEGPDCIEFLLGLFCVPCSADNSSQNARPIIVVTFNSEAILLPLVAMSRGSLSTLTRLDDIRVMAWMLEPHETCADFDRVLLTHMSGASCPSGSTNEQHGVAQRAALLLPLHRKLYRQLGTNGMLPAFLKVECEIPSVCAMMKHAGFLVDPKRLEQCDKDAKRKMAELRCEAETLLNDAKFNIQSVDDCRNALYSVLHLDKHLPVEVTKGGRLSTSEETLKQLARFHPLPDVIISYRKLAKFSQTYVDGIVNCTMPFPTSPPLRIAHATFLTEGTDTGRLSCVEPNLQNLPRNSSEFLGSVRRAFVPLPHHLLVSADYEQIELRVLAHMSQDQCLLDALCSADASQCDIHRRIASIVFRKPFESVTPEERSRAKRVVFGVLYGMGVRTLAQQLDISMENASQIHQQFMESFPQVSRYEAQVVDFCRRNGFVRTLLGRCRMLNDIKDQNFARRANAERRAFNTVIQGSAADIMKKSMIAVKVLLQRHPELLLLCQIHDELVFSCPLSSAATLIHLIRETMTNAMSLSVPLVVKVSTGPSLGELQSADFES